VSVTKRKPKGPKKSWLDQLGHDVRPERPQRERVLLAPVYILLIILIIAAVAVSVIWGDHVIVSRFGPGLATEAIGILVTVVFVRRFLEQHERSRRLRASIGALRKARRALIELTDTWATLIKGALPQRPADGMRDLRELCSPDQSDALLYLDPAAHLPGDSNEPWLHWAAQRLRSAQAAFDGIIGTYGGTLDSEYVEALDAMVDDPFAKLVQELADARVDAQKWRVTLNTTRAVRSTHFDRLLQIIRLHNQLSREAAAVRAKGIGPRSESVGVELAPDYDLKLETALEDTWWRSKPVAASLRVGK
jgi:hypothetical protein